jgi:hypothetical protein
MVGLTDYTAKAFLAHLVDKTAFTMPTGYLAPPLTGIGNDAGTGFTEASGGYARIGAGSACNASAGSNASTIGNGSVIDLPPTTASWGSGIAGAGPGQSTPAAATSVAIAFLSAFLFLSRAPAFLWKARYIGRRILNPAHFRNEREFLAER